MLLHSSCKVALNAAYFQDTQLLMGEATVTNPGIYNCLQGAGDSRKQTGEAYWLYVSQADCGKIRCPASSYQDTIEQRVKQANNRENHRKGVDK